MISCVCVCVCRPDCLKWETLYESEHSTDTVLPFVPTRVHYSDFIYECIMIQMSWVECIMLQCPSHEHIMAHTPFSISSQNIPQHFCEKVSWWNEATVMHCCVWKLCLLQLWGPWWLSGQNEHLRDMKCTIHDLEVMGSNPGWVELWVCSTSVFVILEPRTSCMQFQV